MIKLLKISLLVTTLCTLLLQLTGLIINIHTIIVVLFVFCTFYYMIVNYYKIGELFSYNGVILFFVMFISVFVIAIGYFWSIGVIYIKSVFSITHVTFYIVSLGKPGYFLLNITRSAYFIFYLN